MTAPTADGAGGPGGTVIVMPVGPNEAPASYRDTLESIAAFAERSTRVLVLDDTRRPDFRESLAGLDVPIDVLRGPGASGLYGGFSMLVCRGLSHAAGPMGADQVLRMDSDAVMTASGLEAATRAAFRAAPQVGALGSFRTAATGAARSFGPAVQLLDRDLSRQGLRHPTWAVNLRSILSVARRHGYEPGEHALGAAQMFSRPLLLALSRRGWISSRGAPRGAGSSRLGDDHLLGLLVRAAGFETADFGRPGDPIAVSWRGLPGAPEDLVAAGAMVVHSVKDWNDQREADVRARLRLLRTGR